MEDQNMSNTICVNGKYVPFRFDGDTLKALVNGIWQSVEPTGKKNRYGDKIFRIKQA
jgi:hypothetical protein